MAMRSIARSQAGFTLVEALLAIATLSLMAAAISGLYMSGARSLDVQADDMLLQSHLRSRMEELVASDFGTLSDGTNVVTVVAQGQTNTHTITWSATPMDLDGDNTPEPNAKQVTVSLEGQSLTILLVDHEGRLGKL